MRAAASEAFAIDPNTADALLDGRIVADDAPPGYGAVVTVLQASTAPIRPDEIDSAPDAIRRIFEEARRTPAPAPHASGADTRRLVGRWSARAVVIAVVAALGLGGGVALAATGNLPGPLQSAASRVLEVVGIDVPDGSGDEAPAGGTEPPGTPSTEPGSAPAAGSSGGTPADATTTTTVPTSEAPPTTSGTPTTDVAGVPGQGDEVCAEASDGQCRAGEPHPSDSRPVPVDPAPPTTVEPDEREKKEKEEKEKKEKEEKEKDNPSVTAPGQTKTAGPPVATPAGPKA